MYKVKWVLCVWHYLDSLYSTCLSQGLQVCKCPPEQVYLFAQGAVILAFIHCCYSFTHMSIQSNTQHKPLPTWYQHRPTTVLNLFTSNECSKCPTNGYVMRSDVSYRTHSKLDTFYLKNMTILRKCTNDFWVWTDFMSKTTKSNP